MDERWSAVDAYINDLFVRDPTGEAALDRSRKAGFPDISVTPPHGKFLYLLAVAHNARAILEIGTLAGYSTIWLARALQPGGRLITLELDERHAELARKNLERAAVDDRVDIRVGPALDTLPQLKGPFDLVFIDADKPGYPAYFDWALKLSRPGTLIIADNVVRSGSILDVESVDPRVQATRQFLAKLAAEPRVTATVIQTVSSKGYDGLAIASVKG